MRDILFLLLASALWGLWGFAEKKAVGLAHPLTVQWMYASLYVGLLPLLLMMGQRAEPLVSVRWGAFGWAALAALLGLSAILAFRTGLQNVDASIAVAITAGYPAFTLLLSAVSGEEVITPQKVAGILVVGVGVYLISR
jgi:drug/metabolite transporter (DMT)-like permease